MANEITQINPADLVVLRDVVRRVRHAPQNNPMTQPDLGVHPSPDTYIIRVPCEDGLPAFNGTEPGWAWCCVLDLKEQNINAPDVRIENVMREDDTPLRVRVYNFTRIALAPSAIWIATRTKYGTWVAVPPPPPPTTTTTTPELPGLTNPLGRCNGEASWAWNDSTKVWDIVSSTCTDYVATTTTQTTTTSGESTNCNCPKVQDYDDYEPQEDGTTTTPDGAYDPCEDENASEVSVGTCQNCYKCTETGWELRVNACTACPSAPDGIGYPRDPVEAFGPAYTCGGEVYQVGACVCYQCSETPPTTTTPEPRDNSCRPMPPQFCGQPGDTYTGPCVAGEVAPVCCGQTTTTCALDAPNCSHCAQYTGKYSPIPRDTGSGGGVGGGPGGGDWTLTEVCGPDGLPYNGEPLD